MKVPINQKFIENTRVQRFLVANLFCCMQKIQSIDFGDKKSANENL